jgi:transposase
LERRVVPEARSAGGAVRRRLRMGRSTDKETRLSEQRKYRSWTAQQKIEIVLAGLRGDRTVREVCREHEISDTLFYSWRDKLIEGGLRRWPGRRSEAEPVRAVWLLGRPRGSKELELLVLRHELAVLRRQSAQGGRRADRALLAALMLPMRKRSPASIGRRSVARSTPAAMRVT